MQVSPVSPSAIQPLASATPVVRPEKAAQKLADIIIADAVRGNQLDIHA